MIAPYLIWWLMTGIGVAVGLDISLKEADKARWKGSGRWMVLTIAVIVWPIPVTTVLFLVLTAWADR